MHWGLVVADAERQAARDAATADTLREIVGLLGRGGEVPPAKTGRKTCLLYTSPSPRDS